jgi:DMSO/TMAO reductase YedYZ molybdopterin-dependent catalytic subunit
MNSQLRPSVAGLLGALAVGAGLAVAQLIGAILGGVNDPIISIGNRIVDNVPPSVKEFAIRTFGLADKLVLIISISLVILILALVIGYLYFCGKQKGAKLVIATMTVTACAASFFDANATVISLVPSLAAGLITWWTLKTLEKYAGQRSLQEFDPNRRSLMKVVGFISAASAAAVFAGNYARTNATSQIAKLNLVLPTALKPLPPAPVDPALVTPGLSKLFTPNDSFYRIDTALVVPVVDLSTWRLTIDGMVANPLEFTYSELISRPIFELDNTIACVSNEVGGPLVGNARWVGIRLDDLINEVKPESSADQIMGYSFDGFTAGFPTTSLDGRDAMLAFGMNGELLPPEHGFPARIIVPGLYGYVSATKWLTRIELTRFDKAQGYWIPRGWSTLAPIKTAARIDTPVSRSAIKAGQQIIAGVAWAPLSGISKVEVSVNDGPWQLATLGPKLANITWQQWWLDWDATAGETVISARATNGDGQLQSSESVAVAPNGAEGWHTIGLSVSS